MEFRLLGASDARANRQLWRQALRDEPQAFGSPYETTPALKAGQMAQTTGVDGAIQVIYFFDG